MATIISPTPCAFLQCDLATPAQEVEFISPLTCFWWALWRLWPTDHSRLDNVSYLGTNFNWFGSFDFCVLEYLLSVRSLSVASAGLWDAHGTWRGYMEAFQSHSSRAPSLPPASIASLEGAVLAVMLIQDLQWLAPANIWLYFHERAQEKCPGEPSQPTEPQAITINGF